jgi:hypothetical protein
MFLHKITSVIALVAAPVGTLHTHNKEMEREDGDMECQENDAR